MAVIKVQKRTGYTVVDNGFIRDKNLSLKAIGLMLKMCSLPPEWDFSVAGLSAICKEGMTSIRSALKELEENSYLVRERKNSEKGYFVYEYILYESKDLRHTENTHTVETHTANTHTLNRTQINKDLKITNKLKKDKKNMYIEISECIDILDTLPKDDRLRNLVVDFFESRKHSNAPLNRKGLILFIERLRELGGLDVEKQKQLLKTALINGWKNVYDTTKEPTSSEEINSLKDFYE